MSLPIQATTSTSFTTTTTTARIDLERVTSPPIPPPADLTLIRVHPTDRRGRPRPLTFRRVRGHHRRRPIVV